MKPIPKTERIEQLAYYLITSVLVIWDLWYWNGFTFFASAILLPISFLTAIKKPVLAARIAFVALMTALIFYGYHAYTSIDHYFLSFSPQLTTIWGLRLLLLDDLIGYIMRFALLGLAIGNSRWILKRQVVENVNIAAKRKRAYILTFSMLMLLGLMWIHPRVTCGLDGGKWVHDGIGGQSQYCQFQYVDAGMSCMSSNECLGNCIITDRPDEDNQNVGECAPNNSPFGCFALIENPEFFACRD